MVPRSSSKGVLQTNRCRNIAQMIAWNYVWSFNATWVILGTCWVPPGRQGDLNLELFGTKTHQELNTWGPEWARCMNFLEFLDAIGRVSHPFKFTSLPKQCQTSIILSETRIKIRAMMLKNMFYAITLGANNFDVWLEAPKIMNKLPTSYTTI